MLALLATFAQKKFPYKVPQVESNDSLYGGAIDYMQELAETIVTCVGEIVKQLTALGEKGDTVSKLNQVEDRLYFKRRCVCFLFRVMYDLVGSLNPGLCKPVD
jgi:hypothetical protein